MKRTLTCAALAIAAAAGSTTAGTPYYIRSVNGDAWGGNGNEQAMDIEFGNGNYQIASYETLNVGQVFSNNTSLVYIDGGDGNATSFKQFFAANHTAIENWVSAGGCLFANAAGWYETQINLGFQNTIINAPVYDPTFNAADPNNPIWSGPHTPAGTSFSGNYASHGYISGGPSPTTLGKNGQGQPSLVMFDWGQGNVMVGALTDPALWWQPQPNAVNVRANMLDYLCRVPAPSSAALLGLGGLVASRRRR